MTPEIGTVEDRKPASYNGSSAPKGAVKCCPAPTLDAEGRAKASEALKARALSVTKVITGAQHAFSAILCPSATEARRAPCRR